MGDRKYVQNGGQILKGADSLVFLSLVRFSAAGLAANALRIAAGERNIRGHQRAADVQAEIETAIFAGHLRYKQENDYSYRRDNKYTLIWGVFQCVVNTRSKYQRR
jgi:hypothetical protein